MWPRFRLRSASCARRVRASSIAASDAPRRRLPPEPTPSCPPHRACYRPDRLHLPPATLIIYRAVWKPDVTIFSNPAKLIVVSNGSAGI
ncbi:unnamed protein product [Leptosia nina]|uniref:Uncharacterized protein n=1 Tax=Leptosia nina TaxID=320188 RepID=A0AAV1JKV9_9NEOP